MYCGGASEHRLCGRIIYSHSPLFISCPGSGTSFVAPAPVRLTTGRSTALSDAKSPFSASVSCNIQIEGSHSTAQSHRRHSFHPSYRSFAG